MAGGKWSQVESESLTAEGRVTPVEVRASRIEYGGRPALLLHVRDITERHESEAALQSSEMLFRSVWQNSVTGLQLVNEAGAIVARQRCVFQSRCHGRTGAGRPAASKNREEMVEQHREAFLARGALRKPERHVLQNGKAVTLEIIDSFIQLRETPVLMLSSFATLRRSGNWRNNCGNHKRWKRLASSPAVSRMISTTFSPSFRDTPRCFRQPI